MKKDVLRDYMERLIEAMAQSEGFDADLARQIEKQCRQDWAGERCLVRKEPDRELKRQAAHADLKAGAPVQTVMRTHGISRSVVYEILKRRG
jgi:hypothetical protein